MMRSHHLYITAYFYKSLIPFGCKPDDGRIRPKHVVLYFHPLINIVRNTCCIIDGPLYILSILLFLFMVLISLVSVLNLLYFYISTFRSMCAVVNMAVFCSSLTSWFPGMLLTYFLNVFEIAPVAPVITGITFVFTFHMRCISIVRSLYFKIFSASFFFYHISVSWNCNVYTIHVPFSLSRITMSGLLLGIVLSVYYYYYYYGGARGLTKS